MHRILITYSNYILDNLVAPELEVAQIKAELSQIRQRPRSDSFIKLRKGVFQDIKRIPEMNIRDESRKYMLSVWHLLTHPDSKKRKSTLQLSRESHGLLFHKRI